MAQEPDRQQQTRRQTPRRINSRPAANRQATPRSSRMVARTSPSSANRRKQGLWEMIRNSDTFRPVVTKVFRLGALLSGTTIMHGAGPDIGKWMNTAPGAFLGSERKKAGSFVSRAGKSLMEIYDQSPSVESLAESLRKTLGTSSFVRRFYARQRVTGLSGPRNGGKRRDFASVSRSGKSNNGIPKETGKSGPVNDEMIRRQAIVREWRKTLGYISESFRAGKPVIRSWADFSTEVSLASPYKGVNPHYKSGFTVSGAAVLIGREFMKVTSAKRGDNIEALYRKAVSEGLVRDNPHADPDMKEASLRRHFVFNEKLGLDSTVLYRDTTLTDTRRISRSLDKDNLEKSIRAGQIEKMHELEEKLRRCTNRNERKYLEKERSLTKMATERPDYATYSRILDMRNKSREQSRTMTLASQEKQQKKFLEAVQSLKLTPDNVTFYEEKGSYVPYLVVPPELEDMSVRYEIPLHELGMGRAGLTDGLYGAETELGYDANIEIRNGKPIDPDEVQHESNRDGPEHEVADNSYDNSPEPELA